MLKLQTTDNNCGKALSECGADLAQAGDIYKDLTCIANIPLKELIANNDNLLVFPKNLYSEEGIDTQTIFTMHGSLFQQENITITTHNIMGFIGVGNTQIKIRSRFETDKEGKKDFLLYYLLQKVYTLNLFDLKFSCGDGFLDFLLFLFPQFLNKALSQGIFRAYKTFKKNDADIKGPVDISRHIKENMPFNGKIAYTCREYSSDNYLTQLIRHTIEVIKIKEFGKNILFNNDKIRRNIDIIISSTPSYSKRQRDLIIKQNLKPFKHPYFTEYRNLQKLCLAILRHEKLQYGETSNKIYGILFDGAWLWEEYLAIELEKLGFTHAQNKMSKNGISLWPYNKRYPDFYKGKQEKISSMQDIPETNFILDAKYKRLNNKISREDIHQIITYMHILPAKYGGLIYPYTNKDDQNLEKENYIYGLGGYFYTFGIKIPTDAVDYKDFCYKMKESEKQIAEFLKKQK